MTKQYHVYAIANALLDVCFEVSDDTLTSLNVDKGVMTLIDLDRHHELLEALSGLKHKKICGGSAVNTCVTLTDLGSLAFCSCKVANDEDGRFYLTNLQHHGVDSNLSSTLRESGITGKCIVMVTPDTQRTMNTFLGISNSLSEQELMFDKLLQSKYLYIEGYSMAEENARFAAVNAINFAKENCIKTALSLSDPNMVKYFKNELHTLVDNGIDLLFCNEEEALIFTDSDTLVTAQQRLANQVNHFVITLGANGTRLYDGQHFHTIAAHPVHAIDTVGAGDTFAGAYLHSLSQGFAPIVATDIANFAAAQVVTQRGPRLNKTNIEKVKDFIAKATAP